MIKIHLFFTFIFMTLVFGVQAKASAFQCERLFLSEEQIQKIAISMANFRSDIRSAKNPQEKDLLMKEYDTKLLEFARSVGGVSSANKIIEDTSNQLKPHNAAKNLEAKKTEREKKSQLERQEKDIHKWTGFKEFQKFSSGQIFKSMVTPDGSKLITVCSDTGEIKILDLQTMKIIEFPHRIGAFTKDAKISLDGTKLILLVSSELRARRDTLFVPKIFDLSTMQPVPVPLQISLAGVRHISLTGDPSKLILQMQKSDGGRQILNLKTMQGSKASFSIGQEDPRSERLTISEDHSAVGIKQQDGLWKFVDSVYDFVLSQDGSFIAIAVGDSFRTFDLSTGEEVDHSIAKFNKVLEYDGVTFSKIVPDHPKLIGIDHSWKLMLMDIPAQSEVKTPIQYEVSAFAVTPDESLLIVGGKSGELSMLNLENLDEVFLPYRHTNLENPKLLARVSSVAVTPDGSKIITTDVLGNMYILFRDYDEAKKFGAVVP